MTSNKTLTVRLASSAKALLSVQMMYSAAVSR
jgi:hypothetical protein